MKLRRYFADDRWIPWSFVALFGVFLTANIIMVVVGARSWPGLTSDDHYRRGLAYNEHLDALAAESRLGWTVTPDVTRDPSGAVGLEVSLRGADDRRLAAQQVTAVFRRPTHSGIDASLALATTATGRWFGQLPVLEAGQWDLELTVIAGEHRHRSQTRIFLSPANR